MAASKQFRLRTLFLTMTFFGLFLATGGFGCVGLHYPRAVENDPLRAPISVVKIDGQNLHLADGRIIEVFRCDHVLDEVIAQSNHQIDLDTEGLLVDIHVKSRGWICGTPWARAINLPLIPDDVPINRRELVGFGRWVTPHDAIVESPTTTTPTP